MKQWMRVLLGGLVFGLGGMSARATNWVWPDLILPSPCAGTLQDCINAASHGDSIVIGNDNLFFPDRYTEIDGDITISKSLTISAAAGIDAVFTPGSDIVVFTPAGVVGDVTLRGLILASGAIRTQEFGSSSATVTIDQVRISAAPAGQCAMSFATSEFTTGSDTRFVVTNSSIRFPPDVPPSVGSAGICAFSFGDSYRADIIGNRVEALVSGVGAGISVAGGDNAGNLIANIRRNRVYKQGGPGIVVRNNQASAAITAVIDNNIVYGHGGSPSNSVSGLAVIGHTAEYSIINNTLVQGGIGIELLALGDPLFMIGRVANNLLAAHSSYGFQFNNVTAPNDHNLQHDVDGNLLGPGGVFGAGTVFSDPLLTSAIFPWPGIGSPALDSGYQTALPVFSSFDVNGEPRVAFGQVDIGAMERSADVAWSEVAGANASGHILRLDGSPHGVALSSSDHLIVTPVRAAAGVSAGTAAIGVYQDAMASTLWAAFNQDFSVIAAGTRYSVLAPWNAHDQFLHTVSAANIPAGNETQLDRGGLNGQAAAIAVVTANWNPGGGGSGIYHDHPVTLVYRGSSWRIRNDDGAAMNTAIGAAFNVAVAPLFSPNALIAEAGFDGIDSIPLSHPLLDHNPCAAPQVSRRVAIGDGALTANAVPFALEYRTPLQANDIGRWYIVREGASSFAAAHAFNVIVDGVQASRCLAPFIDAVFANGFEP